MTGSYSCSYLRALYFNTSCFSFHCEIADPHDLTAGNHKKPTQNPDSQDWQNLDLIVNQMNSHMNSDLLRLMETEQIFHEFPTAASLQQE